MSNRLSFGFGAGCARHWVIIVITPIIAIIDFALFDRTNCEWLTDKQDDRVLDPTLSPCCTGAQFSLRSPKQVKTNSFHLFTDYSYKPNWERFCGAFTPLRSCKQTFTVTCMIQKLWEKISVMTSACLLGSKHINGREMWAEPFGEGPRYSSPSPREQTYSYPQVSQRTHKHTHAHWWQGHTYTGRPTGSPDGSRWCPGQ